MEEAAMENSVSVKLEQDYGNQQILLFYVDEGGGNEQSIVTTVEDIQQTVPIDPAQNYYVSEAAMDTESDNNYIVMDASSIIVENAVYATVEETWSETEDKRLLVFYIDNKDTFLKGETKENFLWSVACKTMLTGKTPQACKLKLESLRVKYKEILQKHSFHVATDMDVQWPYFVLAHQAFHNEVGETGCYIETEVENISYDPTHNITTLYDVGNKNIPNDEEDETNQTRVRECNERSERLIIKKPAMNGNIYRTKSNNADASVLKMLNLYLQLQNMDDIDTKTKWLIIANKMEENSREYWHKRFLNYRRHYITLLEKHGSDHSTISWPYMEIFNFIFKDDEEFQSKYNFKEKSAESHSEVEITDVIKPSVVKPTWSTPEKVILVKHYFDNYSEHHDLTLPKQFLWSEIGRLLDKDPANCKAEFEDLRANHLDHYIKGGYSTTNRNPLSILYDHIISMDVEKEMRKLHVTAKVIKSINTNDLVMFFYDNIKLFKDEMCYYVCWAAVVRKLNTSLKSCLLNWYALKTVYKSVLDGRVNQQGSLEKWVYIDIFDEIFDYGTDEKMLLGYEKCLQSNEDVVENEPEKIKTNVEKLEPEKNTTNILEYYEKHKDEFVRTPYITKLWKNLSKEINLSTKECYIEFKSIKAKYLAMQNSGIDESAKQSLWHYYEMCKKIFGPNLKRRRPMHNALAREGKRNGDVNGERISYGNQEMKTRKRKISKWTEISRELLLTLYLRHLKTNRDKVIDSQKMWKDISLKLDKPTEQCKKMFVKLKRLNQTPNTSDKYKGLIDEILAVKCSFNHPIVVQKKKVDYKNVDVPLDILEKALEYYFKNLEEFISEKYNKKNAWRQLSKLLNEPVYKLYQKINYLKTNYDKLQDSSYAIILNLILEKEKEIIESDGKITVKRGRSKAWTNEEKIQLKELYLSFKEQFSNPKYSNKYLWYEIGLVLNRGYKECRKEFLVLKAADISMV